MPPASVLRGAAAVLLLATGALRCQAAAAAAAAEHCDEREDDAAALFHVQSLKRAARLKPEAASPPAPSPDQAITAVSSAEDLVEGLAAASGEAGASGGSAAAGGYEVSSRGFPGGLFAPKTAKQWVRQVGATRTASFTVKKVNKTFDEVFERGLTTPCSEFDYQVGFFGLPLSVAVVNDFPVDVVVRDYEVRNGNEFSGPRRNATIPTGDAAVWHIYTSGTDIELIANVIVQDKPRTKLSLAASRYRVENVFKGCGKMRGLMAWGDDVEKVYDAACDLSYPGMRKKTEYEFAMLMSVSLADADAAAVEAAIAKAAADAVMHAASEQFKNR